MKTILLQTLFASTLCLCTFFSMGQESPFKEVAIASPNAAALGKFVDVPVGMHSGIPQISIPIYSFQEGSLSIPISLDYHAGGLKVQENASWVGAGWSLKAGGMITRTVMGGWPDENSEYAASEDFMHNGGYENYFYDLPHNGDICGQSDINIPNYAKNTFDREPDIFFFNFLGFSGKFFIGPGYRPVVLPEQPLDMQIQFSDASKETISGWIVTDQQGIKYHFGVTPETSDVDAIELTSTYTNSTEGGSGTTVSSWYLNKIESPYGDEIRLEYEEEKYATYSVSLFNNNNGNNTGPVDQITVTKVGTQGVRLSRISSTSSEVNFIESNQPRQDLMRHYNFPGGGNPLEDISNANPTPAYQHYTARSLKEIQISNVNGFCKSFHLEQDYWYDDTPTKGVYIESPYVTSLGALETDRYRMYLRSIQENSCNATESVPPYAFSYYDEHSVPRKMSFAMDHWGFYNGAPNEHLMPNISEDGGATFFNVNPGRSEADRESSWPEMRAGSLQKITYPTGGSTTYQYGHHLLKDVTDCEFSIGSLASAPSQWGQGWSSIQEFTSTSGAVYYETSPIGSATGMVKIDGQVYTGSGFAYVSRGKVQCQVYADLSGLPDGFTSDGYRAQIFHAVASNCTEISQIVGGLRVEKTIQHDGLGENPELITTYDYVNPQGEYTGALFSQPVYVAVIRNEESQYSSGDAHWEEGCRAYNYTDPNTDFFTVKGPQSVHPLITSQGNHFGYKYVRKNYTEGYEIFEYDITNGITVGQASIKSVNSGECRPSYKEFPTAPEDFVFGRGDLTYSGTFNSSSRPVKETYITNSYSEDGAGEVGGIIVKPFGSEFLALRYSIKTGHLSEKVLRNIDYYDGSPHETIATTSYSEQYPFLQSSTIVEDPLTGEVLSSSSSTYVADLVAADQEKGKCQMSHSCYGEFLEAKNLIESTFNDVSACAYQNYTVYSHDLNEARKALKACINDAYTDQETCITANQSGNSIMVNRFAELMLNHREGSIVEQVEKKNGSFSAANYFEYNNELQVSRIYNQFGYDGKVFAPTEIFGPNLQLDNGYLEAQSIKYDGDQIAEIEGRDGIVTSFLWSNTSANDKDHPIAKVIGAPYAAVKAIYDGVGGNLNSLRSHPDLDDAQVYTYSYEQTKGLVQQTDPNGKVTDYSYDDLGRLTNVIYQDQIEQGFDYYYFKN